MAARTLSVRVEVQVEVRDAAHLRDVERRLAVHARYEALEDPAVVRVIHSGTVTRRPSPMDGAL